MTFAMSVAFLLISTIVFLITIKTGSIIYRAVVLSPRDYDGREWFDDYIRIEDDSVRYDPTEIVIVDREDVFKP